MPESRLPGCRPIAWIAVATLLAAAAPAQTAGQVVQRDFVKVRTRILAEAGQRHLRLGSWARDRGLIPQATAQFLRAVDIAEGQNPGAKSVLNLMRSLGDAFWQKEQKRPSQDTLAEFDKRSNQIEAETRKDHAELARRALKAGMPDLAKKHWRTLLDLGGELLLDDRGVWRLDGNRIPDELADWLQRQTARVNGDQLVFEAGGDEVPRLPDAVQVTSERLQVRTDLPRQRAEEFHALGLALWPFLQDRLDGAPTRPLRLFVFARRTDYEAYLQAIQQHAAKSAPGFSDYGTFQTLICAEGLAAADLDGLVLHELSHLFFFGSAPATMPDWYAEGFAETFGGQGTFTWDGTTLTTGGMMRRDRIDDCKAQPIPFATMLAANAAGLLSTQPDVGHRFYAQSWAQQRFLRDPACPWHARFVHFEQKCRGQVLGASESQWGRLGNPEPAKQVFQALFGQDLAELEQAFLAWLKEQ